MNHPDKDYARSLSYNFQPTVDRDLRVGILGDTLKVIDSARTDLPEQNLWRRIGTRVRLDRGQGAKYTTLVQNRHSLGTFPKCSIDQFSSFLMIHLLRCSAAEDGTDPVHELLLGHEHVLVGEVLRESEHAGAPGYNRDLERILTENIFIMVVLDM